MLTVDILLFCPGANSWELLLIRRGNQPFKGKWALPGGFVEMDEELHEAAKRELLEETGWKQEKLTQFHAYGQPGRDPRGRNIAVVYYGFATKEAHNSVKGGDDASEARWFAIDQIPELAFDHAIIINDFLTEISLDQKKK